VNPCTYTPGTWTAVVCDRLVALVGPATPPAAVSAVWDAAAEGGGVHEALVALADAATAAGLDELPPFALVTLTRAGMLHAALRGEAEVSIGPSTAMREVRPGVDPPWTEVTAHDVPAVTLRAGGAGDAGQRLPLLGGVVAAAQVRSTADLWAAPAAAQGQVVLDDHEGLTIVSGDLARLRAAGVVPAGHPGTAARHVVAPAPVQQALLTFSTGLVVPLDRTVLVGRAPQVGRVAAREMPRLVTVPSPQQDISRTHAEVRQEGEHVVVTDLDSLNGTHVSRPGVAARRLRPGEPTVLAPGDVVDLGDGLTFTAESRA